MTAMEILREQIRERIEAVPGIMPVLNRRGPLQFPDKLYRFSAGFGKGFALDRKSPNQVNFWVRADRVTAATITALAPDRYEPDRKPGKVGRHSNLAVIPGFRGETLLCFHPKTLAEAERIIADVLR